MLFGLPMREQGRIKSTERIVARQRGETNLIRAQGGITVLGVALLMGQVAG